MRTSSSSTIALPPALTYLLSRALGDVRRATPGGRPGGRRPPAARLGRLCRDTARYLASVGASRAEIEAALTDAVAVIGVASDPALRAVLDDVADQAHATVAD
jgi:hypothetical protein